MNIRARVGALARAVEDAGLLEDICLECTPDEHRALGTLVVHNLDDIQVCPECGSPIDRTGQSLGMNTTVVMVHQRKSTKIA